MSHLTYTLLDLDFPAGQKNKTAVLVEGEHHVMVFDAGFTRADGHRIVAAVLDTGKKLTRIVVSYGDPDYYFGLEVLADAFPDAAIVATPVVIDHIRTTYEGKLVAWAASGVNLPTRLVEIDPLEGDFDFEGHRFELKGGSGEIPDRHWFWEADSRTVLGGVLLFQDQHVWVADTPAPSQRKAWIAALDEMAAHEPAIAYPGHRISGGAPGTASIAWTRNYLAAFDEVLAATTDGESATARLIADFPDAGLLVAAQLSPKVAKGEMEWH
ncbi:MBL fold metallo-hydrolase [Streptomyces sp. bgisy084]|uniref:MBL fold metallo-hydrolase n=1 Tax=Streptomyces sp. bgisy084 TaxID=3413777 RepID=UPI003D735EC4